MSPHLRWNWVVPSTIDLHFHLLSLNVKLKKVEIVELKTDFTIFVRYRIDRKLIWKRVVKKKLNNLKLYNYFLGSISPTYLPAAFTPVVPISIRIQSNHQYLFTLLGSMGTKAARRTLMKLTPDVDRIITERGYYVLLHAILFSKSHTYTHTSTRTCERVSEVCVCVCQGESTHSS